MGAYRGGGLIAAPAPGRAEWRCVCDLVAALNALPVSTLIDAQIAAQLHERLAAFAMSQDDIQALTVCNPETLLDALGVTYFLLRTAPQSPLYALFRHAVGRGLSGRLEAGTEVAAHYAIAYRSYATVLGFAAVTLPYCTIDETTFRKPFYLVRPRALWDRSDFRRAVFAARLTGAEDGLDTLDDLLRFELVEAVRSDDADSAAWLLVAFTASTAVERAVLAAAVNLVRRSTLDPLLARLIDLLHSSLAKD